MAFCETGGNVSDTVGESVESINELFLALRKQISKVFIFFRTVENTLIWRLQVLSFGDCVASEAL